MRVIPVRAKILSYLGAGAIVLSLAFQNCIQTGDGAGSTKSSPQTQPIGQNPLPGLGGESGNGDGYRGKIYVNRGSCGSPNDIATRIELSDDGKSATKTRENCTDIPATPVSLASLGLMPYNLDNLIFSNKAFDLASRNKTTSLLCRGVDRYTWANGTHNGQPVQVAADVLIFNSSGNYSTQVKLGWMDQSGNLLGSWSSDEFPARYLASGQYEDYQGGDFFIPIFGGPRTGVSNYDLAVNRTGSAPFQSALTMMFDNALQFPGGFRAGFASVVVDCYPQ
jgi:hypothetical protein